MIYKVSSIHQQQAIDERVCDEERDAKFVATSLSLSQVVCQTPTISCWDRPRLMTWLYLIF